MSDGGLQWSRNALQCWLFLRLRFVLRPEQISSGLRLKLTGNKIAFWYDPSATSHKNITVQHFTHNDDLIGEDYLVVYREKLNWLNWSQQRRNEEINEDFCQI